MVRTLRLSQIIVWENLLFSFKIAPYKHHSISNINIAVNMWSPTVCWKTSNSNGLNSEWQIFRILIGWHILSWGSQNNEFDMNWSSMYVWQWLVIIIKDNNFYEWMEFISFETILGFAWIIWKLCSTEYSKIRYEPMCN